MKVHLYVGDICAAPGEVVCTSTNPHLQLVLGTGGALREAGGPEIQTECSRIIEGQREVYHRGYVEPGAVVRTGAGCLPFRGIVHCVATDAFHDSDEDVIRACVRKRGTCK